MITFSGKVRRGKGRGKDLGFATANIPLTKHIEEGIYVSYAIIDETKHKALTFIGKAETFDEALYQSETYILDFSEDLYEKIVTIELLHKLRESEKFVSPEHLVKQMEKDELNAREYFLSLDKSEK